MTTIATSHSSGQFMKLPTSLGHIYIGLDFGMALTKVAVWAKLPQEREPQRFVVEFPRDSDPDNPTDSNRALHLPSSLWVGEGYIHAIPTLGTRRLTRIDGIKQMLLDGWNSDGALDGAIARLLDRWPGWNSEKLAILKLAVVLRYVDVKTRHMLQKHAPGSQWLTLINAAVPPEAGEFDANSRRALRMRSLIERAWAVATQIGNAEDRLPVASALHLIDGLYATPLLPKESTSVEVIPEALAAAHFQITAEGVEPGNWLTVDVGALTTDTSYFFFNPNHDYRIACYSTLQSTLVGTNQLIKPAQMIEVKGLHYTPHEAIARNPKLVTEHADFNSVIRKILAAVKSGLVQAMKHQGESISAIYANGTPRFRVLLVGGGSDHHAIAPRIQCWQLEGIGPVECAVTTAARIPKSVQVLGADAVLRTARIPTADHAILTIAVGLAQRRIDLPRWRTDDKMPRFVPKDPPVNLFVGHH